MASEEELAGIRPDTLTNTITKTELELGKLAPNLQAIAEYRKKEELYLNRVAELDQVPVQPHSALPDVFFFGMFHWSCVCRHLLGGVTLFDRTGPFLLPCFLSVAQVTKDRDEQRRNVETLRKARLSEFMSGFGLITTKLKELYQMITLGDPFCSRNSLFQRGFTEFLFFSFFFWLFDGL